MRYYLTGPLIHVLRSSSSAFWRYPVITARVSTTGIKRLSCWYKMFQAFGLKSKLQGQEMSSIVSMDPNHSPLTTKLEGFFCYVLCWDIVKGDEGVSCMDGERLWCQTPRFLSHDRGLAVPVTITVWNLAGVGSQQIDERAWKRTPLLGGKCTALIRMEPIVLNRFSIREVSVFGWHGCSGCTSPLPNYKYSTYILL